MSLATASPSGEPSVRTVLLKDVDANGFVFFTHYDSRKGHDLEPQSARQPVVLLAGVRTPGAHHRRGHQGPREESEAYFATRPIESQMAAWAATQSTDSPIGRRSTIGMRSSRHDMPGSRYPARRAGAASASRPSRSSSGRGVRRGCTIGCSIRGSRRHVVPRAAGAIRGAERRRRSTDERALGHEHRLATHLHARDGAAASLNRHVNAARPAHLHALPADDLSSASARYEAVLPTR